MKKTNEIEKYTHRHIRISTVNPTRLSVHHYCTSFSLRLLVMVLSGGPLGVPFAKTVTVGPCPLAAVAAAASLAAFALVSAVSVSAAVDAPAAAA